MKERTEAEIERECVEEVFRLTGGELNDKPWVVFCDPELTEEDRLAYSYDGTPEWADEANDTDHTYVTVVSDCSHGEEPEKLYTKGSRYEQVQTFVSSGECECPFKHVNEDDVDEDDPSKTRPCVYCEAQAGEEHGYIYLGEGWCETVYREIKTCETCRTDLTSHDYGDDRCLKCSPFVFTVEAEGAEAYGGSNIVYSGSSPEEAEAAFATWASRCDVTLYLDGEPVESSTEHDRHVQIRARGLSLLVSAEHSGGPYDWKAFHDFVQETRKPWDDHSAAAIEYVRGYFTGSTQDSDSRIEVQEYVDGVRIERTNSFPRRLLNGKPVPVDAWQRTLTVYVWKRTGKIESWRALPGTYTLPDGRVVTVEEKS